MRRNEFLKAVAGIGAVALAGKTAVQAARSGSPWPALAPEDERFWEFIRGQFPLTRERAYFNTGGLGASPYVVIDAVKSKIDELEKICETGHDEGFLKSIKESAAALLGCDWDELAFVRNTTEGINIIAHGFPLQKADEVILTTEEHVGNAFTWLVLQKRVGIVLKFFSPSTASKQETLDRLAKVITRKTRLISIPHAMTTTGMIMPVREISQMARAKKIWFFVDGAQTAGMFPFSLHDLGCDAYATSGHKWLMGPKETGLFYVRRDMLDVIQTKFVGAHTTAQFDVPAGTYTFLPSAGRYEYGTVSIPLRAGLGAAIEFVQKIGIETMWRRDQQLSTRLFDGLRTIPEIRVLSPENPELRSAMVTFMHDRIPYMKLQEHLNTYQLRTRSVSEGGMAALRISTHIYNSPAEVDRVLEGVRSAKA